MIQTTTSTETTYRAVILHTGKNGEDFGRSMNAPRATLAEAHADRLRINGGDFIRPSDEVVIETTIVTTTTAIL